MNRIQARFFFISPEYDNLYSGHDNPIKR